MNYHGTGPGKLISNALLWLLHMSDNPLHTDWVKNIVGPWVNCEEERERFRGTLREYYTKNEDLGVINKKLGEMFETLLEKRYVDMEADNGIRGLFALYSELTVDHEVRGRVMKAATEEAPTYFWTARWLEGHDELITDATVEAVVEEYIIPGRRWFTIGLECETFNKKDRADECAKDFLSRIPGTDKAQETFRTTGNVSWKIETSDQKLKFLGIVVRVQVSSIGDRRQS